jgi:hypothetical protein
MSLAPINVIQAEQYSRPKLAQFQSVLDSAREVQQNVLRMQEFKLRAQQNLNDQTQQQVSRIQLEKVKSFEELKQLQYKRSTDQLNNQAKFDLEKFTQSQENARNIRDNNTSNSNNDQDNKTKIEVAKINASKKTENDTVGNSMEIAQIKAFNDLSQNYAIAAQMSDGRVIAIPRNTNISKDIRTVAKLKMMYVDNPEMFADYIYENTNDALGAVKEFQQDKKTIIDSADEKIKVFKDVLSQVGKPNIDNVVDIADGATLSLPNYSYLVDKARQGDVTAINKLKTVQLKSINMTIDDETQVVATLNKLLNNKSANINQSTSYAEMLRKINSMVKTLQEENGLSRNEVNLLNTYVYHKLSSVDETGNYKLNLPLNEIFTIKNNNIIGGTGSSVSGDF